MISEKNLTKIRYFAKIKRQVCRIFRRLCNSFGAMRQLLQGSDIAKIGRRTGIIAN